MGIQHNQGAKFKGIFFRALVSHIVFYLAFNTFAGTFYNGGTGEVTVEADFLDQVKPGQVLLLSEIHDSKEHHDHQKDILKELIRRGLKFSVGMEFFDYTKQTLVSKFTKNLISEDDFLKEINWGTLPFEYYRFQTRIPAFIGGYTIALNFPRSITNKVRTGGILSLSPEELALFPPNFELGSATYFKRFVDAIGGHGNGLNIENFFAAQSIWDDTMAWRSAEFLKNNPDHVLVVIVGDFHVAYQDGLIARMRARGLQNILSLSQIDTQNLTDDEKKLMIRPDPEYGARANYIYDVQ